MPKPFDMPPQGASFEDRGGWVTVALIGEFGLTINQAAGFVGNPGFESGGFTKLQELRPAVPGSRGGFGWPQWTGPRRRAFEAWAAKQKLDIASDEANYGYIAEELHTTYSHTLVALRQTRTLEDAVFSVGQTYERPGGTTPTHLPAAADRLKYAQRALVGAKRLLAARGGADVLETPTPVAFQVMEFQDAVRKIQTFLKAKGFYTGTIDSDFGPNSRDALRRYLAGK